MKTVRTTCAGYADWRAQAPWGTLGRLGEAPVFLISSTEVRAASTRRPVIAPRGFSRSATPFTYAPRVSAVDRSAVRPVVPPATLLKKCGGCGTPVATPWLLWNVCNCCGRVRPPTPAEQAAQLQHRLAARGA
jgi:hypothetical protein